jgi:N utilization substance protein B
MPSRHRSRQRALQILFQVDVRKQAVETAIEAYYDSLYSEEFEDREGVELGPDPFMEDLVKGTVARAASIDRRISEHSQNWRLERMPAVDRNIIRMAVFEMTERITPPAVVINEALELARRFSGEESVGFINGILDTIRRETPGLATEPAE